MFSGGCNQPTFFLKRYVRIGRDTCRGELSQLTVYTSSLGYEKADRCTCRYAYDREGIPGFWCVLQQGYVDVYSHEHEEFLIKLSVVLFCEISIERQSRGVQNWYSSAPVS